MRLLGRPHLFADRRKAKMDRKKIVFMIDVQPLEAENGEKYMKDITKQIRFCILRILTYFGGKHKESGRKGNSGPLWGYKFYKSKGGHLEYGNHHLYDLKLDDFQNFEDELEDKFQKAKEEEKLKKSLSTRVSIAEQFSCVLAEIVANFQWERPDFFSPVKSNKKANKNLKITPQMDKSFSNFVFLFTSCPGCCRDSDYFSKKYPKTSFELQNALIKDELSQKMINDCRISFNWIDTGCQVGNENCFPKAEFYFICNNTLCREKFSIINLLHFPCNLGVAMP